MPRSSFIDYLLDDAFSHITGITVRAMFGGHGVYKDGLFFALVDDDVVYFKVDETNKNDYEEHDSMPFVYMKKGKKHALSYYSVPEHILEDKQRLEEWIQKSVVIARRTKTT